MTRLLWSFGYPSFAPLSGNYQVGAIQTRLPGSIACQIHYPADPTVKAPKEFVPYYRPQAMEGMADYSKVSPEMMRSFTLKRHPCRMNAEPMTTQTFPLVLFSHGLGGSMEMYTQLCQQIASHGYLVVAMEHEDGSGAYAETSLGKPIYYERPDDSPYSREKVLNFRRPFLEQRVEETTSVLDVLLNNADSVRPEVQKILKLRDTTKGISFVGHSFGGATMILAAQKYLSQGPKAFVPKSLSVLDAWAFSMDDQALNQGVDLPLLSILSEQWLTNPETKQVDQFLQHCPQTCSFYIPRSVHVSFSDAVGWLPRFLGSRLALRGKKESAHVTIPTAAKACVQQIQFALKNNDKETIQSTDTLQVYNYQKGEEAEAEVTASS